MTSSSPAASLRRTVGGCMILFTMEWASADTLFRSSSVRSGMRARNFSTSSSLTEPAHSRSSTTVGTTERLDSQSSNCSTSSSTIDSGLDCLLMTFIEVGIHCVLEVVNVVKIGVIDIVHGRFNITRHRNINEEDGL